MPKLKHKVNEVKDVRGVTGEALQSGAQVIQHQSCSTCKAQLGFPLQPHKGEIFITDYKDPHVKNLVFCSKECMTAFTLTLRPFIRGNHRTLVSAIYDPCELAHQRY